MKHSLLCLLVFALLLVAGCSSIPNLPAEWQNVTASEWVEDLSSAEKHAVAAACYEEQYGELPPDFNDEADQWLPTEREELQDQFATLEANIDLNMKKAYREGNVNYPVKSAFHVARG